MPQFPALTIEHTRPFMLAALMAAVLSTALRVVPQYLPHYLPHRLPHLPNNVDPGVIVLFVPLCALMLALLFETARIVVRHGALPDEAPPHARAIPHWQDSRD